MYSNYEDRIRELIEKAIVTTDAAELETTLSELRELLRKHIHQAKTLALASLKPIRPAKKDQQQHKD